MTIDPDEPVGVIVGSGSEFATGSSRGQAVVVPVPESIEIVNHAAHRSASLVIVCEGQLPDGARWQLRTGRVARDYVTMLAVTRPDGATAEGGMAGQAVPAGRWMSCYVAGQPGELQRIIVRSSTRVGWVRATPASRGAAPTRLTPVHTDHDLDLHLFAAVLDPQARIGVLDAHDQAGQVLESYRVPC